MLESSWLLFLGGIGVLLASAEVLIKSVNQLAAKWKLSPLVLGTTIVAVGTSLPELTVAIVACLKGDSQLALGNIIGSNTANLLMVLPLASLFTPIRIGTTKTQRNALFLLIITLGFAAAITWWWQPLAGGLLLFGVLVFSYLEYSWGVEGRNKEDKKQWRDAKKSGPYTSSALGLSLLGVIAGGYLTVTGAEKIAYALQISTTAVGMTLVALATVIPEILVTVISGYKNQAKLAVGNILGSNIYNILLIGGIIALLSGQGAIIRVNLIPIVAATGITVGLLKIYQGRRIPRPINVCLLLFYAVYFYFTITQI